MAWPKKVRCQTLPPAETESRVLNKGKNFWPQIWHDQKKLDPGPPHPSIRIGSGKLMYHFQFGLHRGKMSFWNFIKFGMTKKGWVLDTPPNPGIRIGSGKLMCHFQFGLHRGKMSFWNFIKFGMTKKSWVLDPPPPPPLPPSDETESRALNSGKNFWPQIWHDQKKFRSLTPPSPPAETESTALNKGKNFWPQIWHDQKKLGPGPPLPPETESRALNKGKHFWPPVWHYQKKLGPRPPSPCTHTHTYMDSCHIVLEPRYSWLMYLLLQVENPSAQWISANDIYIYIYV